MQAGNSNKAIAAILKRSTSTIGREWKRNYGYGARNYDSERAQKLAKQHRKDSKGPRISEKIWAEVFRLYDNDWTPEQISGVLKLQGISVSHESIYYRVYAEIEAGDWRNANLRGFLQKIPQNLFPISTRLLISFAGVLRLLCDLKNHQHYNLRFP